MPALKDQRQERFAQNVAKGMSQVQAGLAAGYKAGSGNMSKLAAKPHVYARIRELEDIIKAQTTALTAARDAALGTTDDGIPKHDISVAWLKHELVENLRMAREAFDFRQANESVKLLAQIAGVLRSGSGGDHGKRKPGSGLEDDDEDDLPNTRPAVAVQVVNNFPRRLDGASGNRDQAEPSAIPESAVKALPAHGDDRAFAAVDLLGNVEEEDGEEVPGAAAAPGA